ncbi:MAG: V-type ATP synthase subunit D [Promethearchaeia archaeon]
MSFRDVKPTKTNLIELKKKLDFIQRGEKFLKFKRQFLMNLIKDTWPEYNSRREDFLNYYRKIILKLNVIYEKMGKRALNLISKFSSIHYSPKVEVNYSKEKEIIIPKINFKWKKKNLPPYSFDSTTSHLDDLIEMLKQFMLKIISFAESENIMYKAGFDYEKVNRRINGLKNVLIPDLELNIEKIKDILEEEQRENFVRFKKTKDLLKKKER